MVPVLDRELVCDSCVVPRLTCDSQVPGFAGYKIITLVGPYVLPSLFRRSTSPVAAQAGVAAPVNGAPREDGELSKRQAKLKARAEKGDKRIRTVERRQ